MFIIEQDIDTLTANKKYEQKEYDISNYKDIEIKIQKGINVGYNKNFLNHENGRARSYIMLKTTRKQLLENLKEHRELQKECYKGLLGKWKELG